MNTRDPWDVLIWAMELHANEALGPEPQSVKDQKWLHIDAASDCAKAALPYTKVKAEGAQMIDPTAELVDLRRAILGRSSEEVDAIIKYLKAKSN